MKGDWDDVNWIDFSLAWGSSAMVGGIRILQLIRKGRKLRWVDILLEPALAVFAGLLVWGLLQVSGAPEVMKTVIVSLGAWGGPHTIHKLEVRYFGGTRSVDSGPMPLDK